MSKRIGPMGPRQPFDTPIGDAELWSVREEQERLDRLGGFAVQVGIALSAASTGIAFSLNSSSHQGRVFAYVVAAIAGGAAVPAAISLTVHPMGWTLRDRQLRSLRRKGLLINAALAALLWMGPPIVGMVAVALFAPDQTQNVTTAVEAVTLIIGAVFGLTSYFDLRGVRREDNQRFEADMERAERAQAEVKARLEALELDLPKKGEEKAT
jgi:MFS family permease